MNEIKSVGGEGSSLNFEIGLGPAAIDKVRVRVRGEEIVRCASQERHGSEFIPPSPAPEA